MKFSISICVILLCCVSQVYADDFETGNDQAPDTVFLKSGGELRGKVVSEIKDEDDGRKYVVFRTESGGLVKLDAARLIKRIKVGDAIDAEYQRRLEIAANDPNLLWKVHEWCRNQVASDSRKNCDFCCDASWNLIPMTNVRGGSSVIASWTTGGY